MIHFSHGHRLLRTHVRGCADRDAGSGQSLATGNFDGTRNPKVGDDSAPTGQQNVFRLDVAVNDAMLMRVTEGRRDVIGDLEGVVE